MADISALYPQPAPNPGVFGANPQQALSALQQVNQLQLFPMQYRQAQLQNAQSEMALAASQNEPAMRIFSGLANDPNLKPDSVRSAAVTLSRIMPNIPSSVINGWQSYILSDPQGPHHALQNMQNIMMGAGAAASRVPGPPGIGGVPTSIPLGSAGYFQGGSAGGQNYLPGTMGVGNPPGFAERQAGGAQLDTQLAGQLGQAAEAYPQRIAALGNLEKLLGEFTSGPGADWTKVAKAWINRNVPLPAGMQFDPKSIASQEDFVKQASMLAQQQFATMGGTGTDAKFNSAFTTNPHDTLSSMGNKRIIALLKGNEDALNAKNTAWINASQQNPNLSYRAFSQGFNMHFDPRVFQFKYMTPKERQEYINNMSASEQRTLMNDIATAKNRGWIDYVK